MSFSRNWTNLDSNKGLKPLITPINFTKNKTMNQEQIKARLLSELPAPYGEQAADNVIEGSFGRGWWHTVFQDSSLSDVVNRAFLWSGTPQGQVYWQNVFDSLNTPGAKIEEFLGEFTWDSGFPVKVWKGVITVGCQVITPEEANSARKRENFDKDDVGGVIFSAAGMDYGDYFISEWGLKELFKKFDELGF